MGFAVGGPTAWRKYVRGNVLFSYHWVQGEPALVVAPAAGNMRLTGAGAWVLPLQAAHDLVKEGSKGVEVDSHALYEKALFAAEVIGYKADRHVINTIADGLLHGLDLLADMPPEPTWHERQRVGAPNAGELTLKVDGKAVMTKDI